MPHLRRRKPRKVRPNQIRQIATNIRVVRSSRSGRATAFTQRIRRKSRARLQSHFFTRRINDGLQPLKLTSLLLQERNRRILIRRNSPYRAGKYTDTVKTISSMLMATEEMSMKHNAKRFGGFSAEVEMRWEVLPTVLSTAHDARFLRILHKHGFASVQAPVPLIGRYSKGRKWTIAEFNRCYEAWRSGKSLTLIAATLNRNPQDMIYKLLRKCREAGLVFSQKGQSEGNVNWTPPVAQCAAELFEAGLPAWKIAVLFKVDFEFVEKAVFLGRPKYGHDKKNPFAICTDHKQVVNRLVISQSNLRIRMVLDSFAGEGRFSRIVEDVCPAAKINAIESDPDTFARATKSDWTNALWTLSDNINEMEKLTVTNVKFDF